VAELAGPAAEALIDLAVQHQTAADARAKGDHQHVLAAGGGAAPLLAQGGTVGVIVEVNRHAQLRFQERCHGHVLPVQVDCVDNNPACAVTDTGGADTGPLQLLGGHAGCIHGLASSAGHVGNDAGRPQLHLCGRFAPPDDLALVSHDACFDCCSAQINAKSQSLLLGHARTSRCHIREPIIIVRVGRNK
jgi:hypothetical protein